MFLLILVLMIIVVSLLKGPVAEYFFGICTNESCDYIYLFINIIIIAGFIFWIFKYIKEQKIKSFKKEKKLKSFRAYDSSNHKNHNLSRSFSEIIDLFFKGYEKRPPFKKLFKKAYKILARDIFNMISFVFYIFLGLFCCAIIFIIIFKLINFFNK